MIGSSSANLPSSSKAEVKPGATFAHAMRALARATLAAVDDRRAAAIGRLTGLADAVETPDLRAHVLEITKSSYDVGARWLRTFGQEELPMPADVLVRVIHALIEGLVWQRILTPELCPDKVFHAAFAALASSARSSTRSSDPALKP